MQKLSSLGLILAGKYRTYIQIDGQTKSQTTDIHSKYKSTGFHHFKSWNYIAEIQFVFQLQFCF
jgi:hypothetical protein